MCIVTNTILKSQEDNFRTLNNEIQEKGGKMSSIEFKKKTSFGMVEIFYSVKLE